MAVLFAATYPDRTVAIALIASFARMAWAPDYPWGVDAADYDTMLQRMEKGWGTGVLFGAFAGAHADDRPARERWARFQRRAASPGAALAVMRMVFEVDARPILSAVRG